MNANSYATFSTVLLIYGGIIVGGLGFPIFLEPLLVGIGLCMRSGDIGPTEGILLTPACLVMTDSIWYAVSRRYGMGTLEAIGHKWRRLNRAIQKAESVFKRIGIQALLYSRFVPGLTMVAPPMAGAMGEPVTRFVFFDLVGIFLYTSLYIGIGYYFAGNYDRLLATACAWCNPLPYLSFLLLITAMLYIVFRKKGQRPRSQV